jgi:WD40 repeat protein
MLRELTGRFAHAVTKRAAWWRRKAQIRGGYKAFVSYKHENDSFPVILETALKRYAKPWLTPPIRIFRDEKYIVPSPDLPALISAALIASDYLILLASPSASKSDWVCKELDQWCRELGRADRLIIVLLSGTIDCDPGTREVIWETSTALPAVLRPYVHREPFYLDFRELVGTRQLSLEVPEFKQRINSMVAKLRDIEPAEMFDSAILEHRRNIRLRNAAVASLATLTILSVGAAFVAVKQREEARRQAATAISRQLAAQADEMIKNRGDLPLAALLAAEARRRDPTTSEAFNAANRALLLLPVQRDFSVGHPIGGAQFSENGLRLLVLEEGSVELWDTYRGRRISQMKGIVGPRGAYDLNASATRLAVVDNCKIIVFDAEEGTAIAAHESFTPARFSQAGMCTGIHEISMSDDGEMVVFGTDDVIHLWNVASGKVASFKREADWDSARLVFESAQRRYSVDPGYGDGQVALVLRPVKSNLPPPRMTLPVNERVQIAFDGGFMAVTSWETADVWKLQNSSWEKITSIPLSRYVSIDDGSLRYPPPGYFAFGPRPLDVRMPWMLVAAGSQGKITTWRFDPERPTASTDSPLSVITHEGIIGIRFATKPDHLLSWSSDNTASMWEGSTELVRVAHEPTLLAATFGKDLDIWTADASGSVRLSRPPCHSDAVGPLGIIRSLSGTLVGLSDGDERFQELWSAGPCIGNFTGQPGQKYLAVWNKGNSSRAARFDDQGVRVIDLTSGLSLLDLSFVNMHLDTASAPYTHGIGSAAFSPDGRFLVIYEMDSHRAHAWELRGRRELTFTNVGSGRFFFFTEDGERAGTILPDGGIAIGQTATGKIERIIPWSTELERRPSRVSGIHCAAEPYAPDRCGPESRFTFSRDGRYLAEQEPEVRIWDVSAAAGREPVFAGERLAGLGFGFGANVYAAVNDSGRIEVVQLGDIATSTTLPYTDVRQIALSPATPYLAIAAGDLVHVIDTRVPVRELSALVHPGVRRLLFSPDGKLLAGGGQAGELRIWQLKESTWQELANTSYPAAIESLAFSPNNDFLMIGITNSAYDSQSIHKLSISPGLQIEEICQRLGQRRLVPKDCSRYLNEDHCPALCGEDGIAQSGS